MNTILADIDSIVQAYNAIGISISGGFDSALLSYLVHESRSRLGTQNTIEFFTVPRYDDSWIHAERVINYIDITFNRNVASKHTIVGNPNIHHSHQVISGVTEVLRKFAINVLLAGENITPADLPNGPLRAQSNHPRLKLPFFNYTKDVLVQLAIDKNLTEIMKISHTCTESTTLRCNMCWQCRERAWAFKQCGYTDPGTM